MHKRGRPFWPKQQAVRGGYIITYGSRNCKLKYIYGGITILIGTAR